MSIKVALEHRTTYTFAEPVTVHPHVVRLRPAPHSRTPIEAYSLDVKPAGHFLNWQQDPFGNWLARLVFPEKVRELDITVGLVADMIVVNPFDFFVEEYAERFPFAYEPSLAADLAPYLRAVDESGTVAAFRETLPALPADGMPIVDFLVQLNTAVFGAVAYEVRMEVGVQSPDFTLRRAIGSCRDSAWLLVSLLRQYGLAARFVSGYLVQLATDSWIAEGSGGAPGPEQDFTDLHAWAEVYVPGAGWVGLDATSGLFAGEGHIPLSATPHPSAAAPIEGSTDPVQVTFGFHNEVRRIHEDPRVTAPYTDEAWQRIDALGASVDERLVAGDVRLTMGGEPTFVARVVEPDDEEGAKQWSTDADGEQKRALAGELATRLREEYAVGGAVFRGQGKWYPGEPLPRWQIALQWRTDGLPLWGDPTLFADPWAEPVGGGGAEALAREITRRLGLPQEQLRPAYEDPLAVIAAAIREPEGERPGAEPTAADVAGLDAGITEPTGWVLPIAPGEEWTSPAWSFRRGRLVLSPGSSAVGLRLPLDAITWTDPAVAPEPSYLEAGPPIDPTFPTVTVVDPDEQPTTALAVEERDGHVFVFLPPTERLDDYATLLTLIEGAAATVGQPVVLEGYGPPPDPRITTLNVTPDPGVIEVNL
ncbi:MAG: transglutaminase, partial [Nocardioidaceae bacterium]|nr:transglutaminase [Nocardioidaceae bacterium]